MKINYYQKYISLVLLTMVLSCKVSSSYKSGPKKLNEKYIIEFYQKNNDYINYVKPIEFINGDIILKTDFTFKKRGDSLIDSVSVNYTIITDYIIANDFVKELYLDSTQLLNSLLIYNEFIDKKNQLRFSSKISDQEFKKINKFSKFKLKSKDKEIVLTPANSFCLKSLENLSGLTNLTK